MSSAQDTEPRPRGHPQCGARPSSDCAFSVHSRAAVRAAVAAGYGIEIDIQPSGDGVPMVFHDYDLHRLTGQGGRIRAHSARDLGAIRILDAEDGIPTLAEVLEIVAGRVPLLIEVKDQDGDMGPGVGPLEHAIAQVLAGYAGDVALMSFNPHSVAALAALAPGVARGITTSAYGEDWPLLSRAARDRLRGIPDYDRVGASFISHEVADLAAPRVAELKADGAAILCWTVRSPEIEAKARRYADNITFEGYHAAIPA